MEPRTLISHNALIGDQESPTSSPWAGHVVHCKWEDALLCRFGKEN
jgi:hypothetical protein